MRPLLKESLAIGHAVACVKYVTIHNIFMLGVYFVAAPYSECNVSAAYITNIV